MVARARPDRRLVRGPQRRHGQRAAHPRRAQHRPQRRLRLPGRQQQHELPRLHLAQDGHLL